MLVKRRGGGDQNCVGKRKIIGTRKEKNKIYLVQKSLTTHVTPYLRSQTQTVCNQGSHKTSTAAAAAECSTAV